MSSGTYSEKQWLLVILFFIAGIVFACYNDSKNQEEEINETPAMVEKK